jgi:hypothetical protein
MNVRINKYHLLKLIFLTVLIFGAIFAVYGQNSTPVDLILLLDVSSGMASSYEIVNDYLTGPFLAEFLRIGDTFHLISYSGTPKLDIARRISGIGDVETIIGRMLIQYPIESTGLNTSDRITRNFNNTIEYTVEYITTLPSRPKKIVMIGTGNSETGSLVSTAKQRLGSLNTTLDFITVTPGQPLVNLPVSGRPSASRQPAATRQTTQTQQATQTQQTTQQVTQAAPSQTPASGTTPVITDSRDTSTSSDILSPDRDITTTLPGTSEIVVSDTPITSINDTSFDTSLESYTNETSDKSSDETLITRDTSVTRQPVNEFDSTRAAPASSDWSSSLPLFIGIGILALVLLGLIIFFASRKLTSSPNRVIADVSKPKPKPEIKRKEVPQEKDPQAFVDHSKDLASYAAGINKQRTTPYTDRPLKPDIKKPAVINPSGPLLLNLYVEDQNTAIGKRNIHSLKSGYKLSIGGSKHDDYFIFLVSVPGNIGEIRRNGSQCTFIPRKPKYFPDLGSKELKDCINKTIRIISDKKYEIHFRFEMYEDPLVELNRVLMSVSVPG